MVVFNAWYYSFSPHVASYLSTHSAERTMMKIVLYPLIGILAISSSVFSVVIGYPELAALTSGLVASSLIGGLYLGLPLTILRCKIHRTRGRGAQGLLEKSFGLTFIGGIAALLIGEVFASPLALMLSTSIIVLSVLFLSAALTSAKIANKLQGMVKGFPEECS